MKRLIMFAVLAVLIALPITTVAQENVVAGQFGVCLQDGYRGEIAWGIVTDISVNDIWVIGQIATKVEASLLFSNRPWDGQSEMNVARLFSVRQFQLTEVFYMGLGGGIWHMVNTNASDASYFALRGEAGFHVGSLFGANLELYGGADIVQMPGPDLFYPHISLSIL